MPSFIEYYNNDIDYRKALIKLLEDSGATHISKYMIRTESPSDVDCTLFYKILKKRPDLVKETVNELPNSAKNKLYYATSAFTGVGQYIPFFGNSIKGIESEAIIKETIKIKKNYKI